MPVVSVVTRTGNATNWMESSTTESSGMSLKTLMQEAAPLADRDAAREIPLRTGASLCAGGQVRVSETAGDFSRSC